MDSIKKRSRAGAEYAAGRNDELMKGRWAIKGFHITLLFPKNEGTIRGVDVNFPTNGLAAVPLIAPMQGLSNY